MSDGRPEPDSSRDAYPGGQLISGAELAELLGVKPATKLEMVMLEGGRLFRREIDGMWWEYPAP